MYTVIFWNTLIGRGIFTEKFDSEEKLNAFVAELKRDPVMGYVVNERS